jgi:hypothetical protein
MARMKRMFIRVIRGRSYGYNVIIPASGEWQVTGGCWGMIINRYRFETDG